ncbi:MAG: hypothetical protein NVS1B12_14220 [Acidimicrobiales bacterium]
MPAATVAPIEMNTQAKVLLMMPITRVTTPINTSAIANNSNNDVTILTNLWALTNL